jgi:hypothetical protein
MHLPKDQVTDRLIAELLREGLAQESIEDGKPCFKLTEAGWKKVKKLANKIGIHGYIMFLMSANGLREYDSTTLH